MGTSQVPREERDRGVRRARQLRADGALPQALSVLGALRSSAPEDPDLSALTVKFAQELPDPQQMRVVLEAVLEDQPDHVAAHIAMMDYHIKTKSFGAILKLFERLSRNLREDPRLVERYAHALFRCDRPLDAVRLLDALPKPHGARASVRLKLAQAYRSIGDLDAAMGHVNGVLQNAPAHHRARLMQVQILGLQGEYTQAEAACDEGLQEGGPAALFLHEKAKQLNAKGAFSQQLAVLDQLVRDHPDFWKAWLDSAALKAKRGDTQGALAAVERVPRGAEEYLIAVSRRAVVLGHMGRAREAVALLEGVLSEQVSAEGAQADMQVELYVRYHEALSQTGQPAAGAGGVADVLKHLAFCTQKTLCDLYRLGVRRGDNVMVTRSFAALMDRQILELPSAELLLELTGELMSLEERAAVLPRLRARVRRVDRGSFDVTAAAVCAGPAAAVRCARAGARQNFGFKQAERLGALLLASGRAPLAVRYLRRCVRRWPDVTKLHDLLFEALLICGATKACRDMIAQVRGSFAGVHAERYEVKLLIAQSNLDAAVAICKRREARGLRTLGHAQMLQLYLAVGDLEAAGAAIGQLKQMWGAGSKMARHFRVSYLGQLYDEAQLQQSAQTAERDHAQSDATDVARFFFPAAQVVKRAAEQGGTPVEAGAKVGSSIPKTVFQYWDTDPVPEEVQQVMESWQKLPGFEYRRFCRSDAIGFLRDTFGPSHERAFLLANNVAEECDFLRLCLLYHFGGVYADADDRHLGGLDVLLDTRAGMILFREPFGAVANNFFCAAPGHPVLKIAMDLACGALVGRSRECTWSKTGPGLLTRATAVFLAQPQAVAQNDAIRLLSDMELRQVVCPHVALPYKSNPDYWNAQDQQFNANVRAALLSL